VSAPNVQFGSAYYIAEYHRKNAAIDGVLGLGVGRIVGSGNVTIQSPVQKIVSALDKPIVTVWEEPSNFTMEKCFCQIAFNNGSVTFGAENTVECSPNYTYVAYNDSHSFYRGYPTVSLDSISATGFTMKVNTSRKMLFFDGFGIHMSHGEVKQIAKQFGARLLGNGLYQVDCEKKGTAPVYNFHIGNYGRSSNSSDGFFKLTVDQYILQQKKKLCYLAFIGYTHEEGSDWPVIFGQQTLQNKCVSIDYKKQLVGFSDGK